VNLNALRDRARSLSGIRLPTLRSDEQIDEVINESYQEVIGLSVWPFVVSSEVVTVPANAEEFSTPSGFTEISSVFYKDNFGKATKMRQTSLDELEELDDQGGEPVYFARINDTDFSIWPVPESSIDITVRGKLSVPRLREGDSPIFAEQFHPILAYRAAVKMLQEEGDDSGRADFYQSEANTYYARMQQFYNKSGNKGLFVMGARGKRRRLLDAY
jgi:hypothetical protein